MPTRGSTKAARLLNLAAHLAAGPRTAADLARQLGVSHRTLQRDLEELPELGHAIERRGRRYHLASTRTTLDPVEALAVHTATRLLVHHTRINERGYRTALTKLANQLPEPARGYLQASIADIQTLSSEGSRTLDHVAQAWFEGRVLRFDYHAPIGSQKPHRNDLQVYFVEISPANLAPYVIGYERSFFHEIRTFALDRMDNVRVLEERYEVPDDFDPHAYLASAWGIVAGPPLEVRLRFRNDVAHRVQARHHRNLRIDHTTDDGDLLVTVTAGQDKNGLPIDLLPWIYAFGPGVEVLAPDHVRDHVARELRDAADAYDPGPTPMNRVT
jgi:predicted DNA-binding transcriptional regulator YafY